MSPAHPHPDITPSQSRAVWVEPGLLLVPAAWADLHRSRWFLVPARLDLQTTHDAELLASTCPEWRPTSMPEVVGVRYPHLSGMAALECHDELLDAAELLRTPLLLVGLDADGSPIAATAVQIAPVLDALHASGARQRTFGPVFKADGITLSVWAPTARHVRARLWRDPTSLAPASDVIDLTPEPHGCWSVHLEPDWRDGGYLFEVEVPRPGSAELELNRVTDPWSTGLTINSTRSVLTNLDDPRWTPDGFRQSWGPRLAQLSDAAIYELHVRDFSWVDPLVHPAHRGTYLAFADDGLGTRHLRSLARAGLNTVHLLPCFDIASINENRAEQLHPTGLSTRPPDSAVQQQRVADTAAGDAYNWGYDPFHWGVPEGSYTTTPTAALGGGRTLEFRQMVQGIHNLGLRVVLDQVFTHTAGSGQAPDSVLDKLVPGYYHRLDDQGRICASTCMNNVATENQMAEHLMVGMLVRWVRAYRVDGFRFDLMGHSSAANLDAVRAALDALTPEADGVDGRGVHLYGEGWNFGEVANNARFVQATQGQVHSARVATFNDRIRDAVRGGHPMDADPRALGFGTGLGDHPGPELTEATDLVQLGLAGNLATYGFVSASGRPVSGVTLAHAGSPAGYGEQPWDSLGYVDAHDNETLWDALTMKLPELSMADRVRMNSLSLACVTLAQSPVLWHAGTDLLRSKSLDRNSYNSGDWFNRLDWSGHDNGFGRGLPPAADNANRWDLIAPLLADPDLKPRRDHVQFAAACAADLLRLRFSTRLFRLDNADLVRRKVAFPVSGTPLQHSGVVAMVIDDLVGPRIDPARQGLVAVFNATGEGVRQQLPSLRGRTLTLSGVQQTGADPMVRRSHWDAERAILGVPPRTVAAFDVLG